MMIYPSIDRLLREVPTKYGLIILASKRAHDMQVRHNPQLTHYKSVKPVGKALEEVAKGDLKIRNMHDLF